MVGTLALWVGVLAAGSNGAWLELTVKPDDAHVYIDGKQAKRLTSGKRYPIAPGRHKLTVKKSGFTTVKEGVTIGAGKTARLKIALKRAKRGKRSGAVPVKIAKRPAKPGKKRPVKRVPATRPGPKKPSSKKPKGKRAPGKGRPTVRPQRPKKGKGKPSKKPRKAMQPKVRRPKAQPAKRPKARKPDRRPSPRPAAKPKRAPPARPAPPPDGDRGSGTGRASLKPWGVFSFVVGGLALTGGVVTGITANEKADEFNRSVDRREKRNLEDDTHLWATGSNVLYGVGATGILLGTLLIALDTDYYATVAPLPDGGTFAGIGGRF